MEKQLINLTSMFLKMNRFVLFLLIAFPLTIKFYSIPSNDFPIINFLLGSIGGIFFLCWLYAVGHNANEKIVSQGISLSSFKYFNLSILILIVAYLLVMFLGTTIHDNWGSIKISYTSPLFLSIIFLCAIIITTAIAGKTLVSAESNRVVGISKYFTTALQLLIAPIGLWFIQPRMKQLHNSN
ncbi:MAG: hypothetical protein IPO63_01680 [Bacteroidetes bacterium]|nr:hypothetical protein [Bacteroidota bacterium]